ncbi:MAG: hypothetical protein JWM36_1281 [Hyphomicrobiales bacterium]|nr:hypothetical protein [Hyphomicrobiales bacterium]
MIRQAQKKLTRRAMARLLAAAIFAAGAVPLLPALAQDSQPARTTPKKDTKAPAKPGAKDAPAAAKPSLAAKPGAAKPAAGGKPAPAKDAAGKAAPEKDAAKSGPTGKPTLVASVGDWGVYATPAGRERTCYALAQPKERAPAALKRDPAYLFISTRPAENVRNEVSIIMGFDVKTEKIPAEVSVGTRKFAMAAQGSHLWVQDSGAPIVDAMRGGSKLTVKAASGRGNQTTDSYSLAGLKPALERVQKECP